MVDLPRNQQSLELGREVGAAVRDVQVPDAQHQDHAGAGRSPGGRERTPARHVHPSSTPHGAPCLPVRRQWAASKSDATQAGLAWYRTRGRRELGARGGGARGACCKGRSSQGEAMAGTALQQVTASTTQQTQSPKRVLATPLGGGREEKKISLLVTIYFLSPVFFGACLLLLGSARGCPGSTCIGLCGWKV